MSSQGQHKRFGRNAVANLTAFAFVAVVSFFVSPLMVKHLGTTAYGVWSLLVGLLGYLALLDFGIKQAVNRYVAHYEAVGAHEESSLILSAALKLFISLGVVAVLASLVLAYVAPMLLNIPEAFLHDSRVVLIVGGFTVGISLLDAAFGGVIAGLQRFDVLSILEIALTIFRAAGTVLILLEGYGIVALALLYLAASVLNALAAQAAARKLYPELRLALPGPMRRQMRTLLSFGAATWAVWVLSAVMFQSDTLLIGFFLPIEAVTFYAIAANLAWQVNGATSAISFLMAPRISALASVGSDQVGAQILAASKATTLIVVPIVVTFVLRGESFINLWMGNEYGSVSGDVLAVLSVVVWLGALRAVAMQSLTGLGKHRILIPGFAAEAIANVALSIALIRPLGILGVAVGTMVPNVVVSLGYLPRCLAKTAGLSQWHLYREALLLPTVSCVPFALGTAVLERFVPATNLVVFFLQVMVVLPLVPVVAWFTCLSPTQRERLGADLERMMRKKD